MLPTSHSLLRDPDPREQRGNTPVPWGTLAQPHLSSIPRGLKQQQHIPTASAGQGDWTQVHQATVRECHVRFLLEPALATAASAVGTDVERTRLPKGLAWLCSNGQPPTMLSTGAPNPGALEELEQCIAGARTRLHQALVRRGELLAQLPGGACSRPAGKHQGAS